MNPKVRYLTRTALLLALTLVAQLMGLPQPITGPLVNMFLFMAVLLVGMGGGSVIGAVTPWVALSRGILAAPLAPMVPFIAASNIALVLSFGLLKKVNKYLAIVVAAVAKFLILAAGVRFFVQVPAKAAQALQTPQLITALIGGVAALIFYQLLMKTKVFESNLNS